LEPFDPYGEPFEMNRRSAHPLIQYLGGALDYPHILEKAEAGAIPIPFILFRNHSVRRCTSIQV
jgi:hypothetical protein